MAPVAVLRPARTSPAYALFLCSAVFLFWRKRQQFERIDNPLPDAPTVGVSATQDVARKPW